MFVHFEAMNILTEQSTKTADQIIDLEQREINQLYEICNTTYVSLLDHEIIRNVMGMNDSEELSSITAYEMKRDLARMMSDQNFVYSDIWLILNHINFGVSTQRTEELKAFLEAETYNDVCQVDVDLLKKEYKGTFVKTRDGFAYLKTIGYPADNTQPINLALMIDEASFREKCREIIPREQGVILLYNSDNQLIFSSEEISDEIAEAAKDISVDNKKLHINNESYIVSSSNMYNIKYIYLLSEKNITKPMRMLKMIIFIMAFFSICIGIITILYLLKRNIKPINDIMVMLGSPSNEKNEFDMIKQGINKRQNESRTLNKQVNLFKPVAMNNFLHNLVIYGDIDRYIMSHLEIRLERRCFVLSVMKVDNMGIFNEESDGDFMENSQRLMFVAIANVFTEILEKFGNVYCGTLQDDVVILINTDEDTTSAIYEEMKHGCSLLEHHLGITGYLAQEKSIFSIDSLPAAYRTIQEQIENMQLSGISGAMLCDSLKPPYCDMENDKKIAFVNHIFNADAQKAKGIFKEVIHSTIPKGVLKYFVSDMFTEAIKEISRKTGNEVSGYEIVNLIMETPKIQAAEKQLLKFIEELCSFSYSDDGIETKVYELISENYMNPDFNVTVIATNFHITPAYLSHKFRERYHMNILDFLGKKRIDHAKRLLLETDRTIEDIYQECGYISRATFVRQFKKYTELTPGKFKQLYS